MFVEFYLQSRVRTLIVEKSSFELGVKSCFSDHNQIHMYGTHVHIAYG